jgi:hypothetical protein
MLAMGDGNVTRCVKFSNRSTLSVYMGQLIVFCACVIRLKWCEHCTSGTTRHQKESVLAMLTGRDLLSISSLYEQLTEVTSQ